MGAAHFREQIENAGALVVGRKLYDFTNAWGGRHPMDVPVVVLTHNPDRPPTTTSFVFVTEGIEAAIAKAARARGRQERRPELAARSPARRFRPS